MCQLDRRILNASCLCNGDVDFRRAVGSTSVGSVMAPMKFRNTRSNCLPSANSTAPLGATNNNARTYANIRRSAVMLTNIMALKRQHLQSNQQNWDHGRHGKERPRCNNVDWEKKTKNRKNKSMQPMHTAPTHAKRNPTSVAPPAIG